jgi:hypothetical protein
MKKELISLWVKTGILRRRDRDDERIKSMINSASTNARAAIKIKLNDETATLIFREIYESVRQLGDLNWWLLGYEPTNHEISIEILKEMNIKEKVKLNNLERFKQIRHDANYRGFRVLVSQTEEITEFWNKCGEEIIKKVSRDLNQ